MKNGLNRLSDLANKLAIYIACTAIIVTAVSCSVQVFSRYVMNNSYSWTEELCRYASVVVYMFGFSIATKHGSNPKIDVFSNMLKGKKRIYHAIYCSLATIICSGIIIYFGIVALPHGARISSSVLKIPASTMYVVIMVALLFCSIHSLAGIANDIAKLKEKEAE